MINLRNELSRLLRIKKNMNQKKPSFKRIESWRYKRVKGGWRAAKGIDSKTRQKLKSGVKSPNVGYRTPKKIRGLHPSGLHEVIVKNIDDLNKINPKTHGIKISATIGNKKRMELIELAQSRRFKIFNLGTSYYEELRMRDLALSSQDSEEETDEKSK